MQTLTIRAVTKLARDGLVPRQMVPDSTAVTCSHVLRLAPLLVRRRTVRRLLAPALTFALNAPVLVFEAGGSVVFAVCRTFLVVRGAFCLRDFRVLFSGFVVGTFELFGSWV